MLKILSDIYNTKTTPSQDLQDLAPISKRRKTVDEDIMEADEF